ncbi:MAG: aminotransferase class I/II-fold pyridoxal phosphate-dependent enzyme [Candidatus Omnitrophica bacterium]|nr:aminotransferase class I/II-fold pyridoxal phosphate-dependent enzyme [Candidatus Omnitrophota bacterium]
MFKEIQLDAPSLGEIEKKYLCQAIDSGFISSVGPFIPEFERKMADYLGVKGAAALQSGTAAIYMALYELGLGPGDEVIVPALTFAATVNPVLYAGATPVIVDVDIKTWNIDPARVKEAVTGRTKAIVPAHLYGNPCHMGEIMDIAREHGLHVIEDATESLGATVDGKHTGSFGNFGCFSFNGNKLITTGGGGMVVGNDIERIEHIRYLANQSKDKDRPGFHSEMGFNFRMTNIEAALGLAQFEQIDMFLDKKKRFKGIYQEKLGGLSCVSFQGQYDNAVESGWLTCIEIEKNIDIPDLMHTLKNKGVPTRRIFVPVNEMPYLKKYAGHCVHAAEIYGRGLCLPGSVLNEVKDMEETALMIRKVLGG